MEGLLQKYQHLKIQLEEITSATNNFDYQNNYIGSGGFGRVYKGEVSHYKGRSMAAIKRLDSSHGQGEAEFLKEVDTLSRYKHENIISLLGFCYQGEEAILVYELASHGSLDCHINSPKLTWSQRLKICLGAAKGLRHLHDPKETHQRLIHCDVKGGNILLDDHWNAKVVDFGFSILGPANEQQSTIITLAAGTHGYIDPLYRMTNTLTKESDVYSFGVVLVEVFCGALCYEYSNGSVKYNLVPTWKECYEQKKLNDIIFNHPTIQPLEQSALKIFSDIAYRCLKESREDRPKMADVVTKLETAFEIQEFENSCYKDIVKSAEPPLKYKSENELTMLLSKGVLLNGRKTWFSLNKRGERCEIISIDDCLGSESKWPISKHNSRCYSRRFPEGAYNMKEGKFKARVQTQFLSPGIRYTVNLVFKLNSGMNARKCAPISLKYKIEGETESSTAYLAYGREDGWLMCELYQFTCVHKTVDLRILFEGFDFYDSIEVDGIEFRPLEKEEHKEDENQPISNSVGNWEDKLPTDYEDFMTRSRNRLQWTTKEEAYSIMSKGFLIDNMSVVNTWFYLDKDGKKCHMLSARVTVKNCGTKLPLPGSRFGEATMQNNSTIYLDYGVLPELVSSETTYVIYLVYTLSEDQSGFEAPMRVQNYSSNEYPLKNNQWYICLLGYQIPLIEPKDEQWTHNPPSWLINTCLPQQRNDGWMEVQLLEFRSPVTPKTIDMNFSLESIYQRKRRDPIGLIIEGIDIRPIKRNIQKTTTF